MDSILTSIKKMLGIAATETSFDTDLIIHINSVLMILTQLGVGSASGYSITDATNKWSDFLPTTVSVEAVKTYVYLKVRLIFDPPLSSSVIEAINKTIAELEFRINIMVDSGVIEPTALEELEERVSELEDTTEELEERVSELEDTTDEHEELFETLVGDEDES